MQSKFRKQQDTHKTLFVYNELIIFVSFDEQSSTAHQTETKYSFVKHYIIYYINF